RAHTPHRRRDLRHRGQPLAPDRRRPRPPAGRRASPAHRQPGGPADVSTTQEVKEQVLAAAKDMLRKGLTEGTAGNLSARLPDGNIVITPSSVDYEAMTLDDLCVIDLDANQ